MLPADASAWHFTPYDRLTSGEYTAEVFGVTDRAGLEMEAPYTWSFEVMEEVGGELLAPPAEAPQAEEGGEPAVVPKTGEPAAEEEPLEAPAGDGGAIESGTPGVLYVRRTSYYYFGGQRVAMRQTSSWGENVVYYLVTDHLGTTSLVLCGNVSGCDSLADGGTVPNGGRVAESRHFPYGAVRWTWPEEANGTLPTDYRFTGQMDVGLGLTHMGARFLDSSLGRWTSADTIVPEPGNPQSLNRFSYCLGNALGYIDPSGHYSAEVVAAYFGVDVSRLDEIANGVYSTWYWMLRAAQDGDLLTIADWWGEVSGEVSLTNGTLTFTGSLGQRLASESSPSVAFRNGSDGGWGGAPRDFSIERWDCDVLPFTWTMRGENQFRSNATGGAYSRTKWAPHRFDWIGAVYDVAGMTLDFLTLGVGGRLPNTAEFLVGHKAYAKLVEALDITWGTGNLAIGDSVLDPTFSGVWGEFYANAEKVGFVADLAGIFIPVAPDGVGLGMNIAGAYVPVP